MRVDTRTIVRDLVEHVRGNFDAGERVVMAHATFADPELVQEALRGFDHAEFFGRDGVAVGHAARETRARRFVVGGQAEFMGKFSDFRLGQSDLRERRSNAELVGGGKTWAIISEIVGVRSVDGGVKPAFAEEALEVRVERRLAEVAAVRGVLQVVGVGKFVGVEELVFDADSRGEIAGVGEFRLGHAGAAAGGRDDVFGTQNIAGDFQNESGVRARAEGDGDASKLSDEGL